MRKFEVYHKATLLGETFAASPQKAISNLRYKTRRLYAPMSEFTAKEV